MRCCPGTPRAFAAAARHIAAPDNPLRQARAPGRRLRIEYAAQAMAVHGALVAASAPLASTVSTAYAAASARASATWRACATSRCTSCAWTICRRISSPPPSGSPATHARCCMISRCGGAQAAARERARQHRVRRRYPRNERRSPARPGDGRQLVASVVALCRRLARDGHHVYVHSHRGVAVAEALGAGHRRRGGGHASAINFDITIAPPHAPPSRRCSRQVHPDPGQTTQGCTMTRCCRA